MLLHNAIKSSLYESPARRLDGMLWVSDLGKNPHPALRRIFDEHMEPFDMPTRLKMAGGQALEDYNLPLIAAQLNRPTRTQVPLFDDIWSGYADLVIGWGSDDPIIYDHKGSAGRWWDYKKSLPRVSDCCQVLMYGFLYEKIYGIMPRTCLYYHGWGTWAEFEIEAQLISNGVGGDEMGITAVGWVTDEKGNKVNETMRTHRANFHALRLELESYFQLIESDGMTLEQIEFLRPEKTDWTYATDNYDRLVSEFSAQLMEV